MRLHVKTVCLRIDKYFTGQQTDGRRCFGPHLLSNLMPKSVSDCVTSCCFVSQGDRGEVGLSGPPGLKGDGYPGPPVHVPTFDLCKL